MAAEELLLLNLFDSNWFGHKTNLSSQSHQEKIVQESDYHDHHDRHDFSFSVPQNLKVRSQSEQLLDPNKLGSFFSSPSDISLSSPISVLPNPKLQTIFSGKEAKDIILPGEGVKEGEEGQEVNKKVSDESERKRRTRRRKRASKLGGVSSSKSLSELEFEELKGFMDLGFVFTEEECKDSKLVSMIPGLQRFGKKCSGSNNDYVDHHHHHRSEDHNDNNNHDEDYVISRPYLSEAWDVLESERKKKDQIVKPLVIDWKIPTLANEIYMKDQIKFWAHSVASTVR